jgi:hypothetical protein
MALNSQGSIIQDIISGKNISKTPVQKEINHMIYNTSNSGFYNTLPLKQDNINMNSNALDLNYQNIGLDASMNSEQIDALLRSTGYNVIDLNTKEGWETVIREGIPLSGQDTLASKIYTKGGKFNGDETTSGEGVIIVVNSDGNYHVIDDHKNNSNSQTKEQGDKTAGVLTPAKDVNLGIKLNKDIDVLSNDDDIETSKEEPETKMTSEPLVDYKTLYELNNTTRDTTYDNERKRFAENETLIYASGMRVSLNIVPINRYSSSSYITSFEYDKRLSYILGDNDFLRTLFSNTNGLIFPYTPQINMQHNVNYEEVEILHSNLTYQYYKNTPPPQITINADFTADTPENALYMLGAIWFFRSMTKSDFGKKANRGENQNYAGMPPPVLYLNGYGKMYDNIPVIIKSFDTPFQKDKHYVNVKVDKNGDWKVNYLSNFDTAIYHSIKDDIYDEWLPTEMTMQITLAVQPNLKKVKDQFDLNSYKKGILGNVIKNSNGINNLDKSTLYNGSGWTW